MTQEEFTALFSLHLRGELARAFMHRGMTPTNDEWLMLHGQKEITSRDIGEMAFRLDCDAAFSIFKTEKEPT